MEPTNNSRIQHSNGSAGNADNKICNDNKMGPNDCTENASNHQREAGLTLQEYFLKQIVNKNNYKRLASEFLGMALLMYFVCAVSMAPIGNVTLIDHAVSAAFGIMVIIFMFGPISGAHVNPTVTFGFALVGRLPWRQVPIYMMGQVMGGIIGTAIAQSLFNRSATVVLSIPYGGVKIAFVVESVSAFVFMFLACSVASNAQVTGLFASVAVAASIAINVIVAGPFSGASMNPARSLAPAILTGYFRHLWVYMVAPFVGANAGAGAQYFFTH